MKKLNPIRVRRAIGRNLLRVLLIFVLLVMLYPIAWNIMSSFKTNQEHMLNPMAFPKGLALENYVTAFEATNMVSSLKNSALVVVVTVAVLLVCAVPCAYVLTRYKFPGSRLLHGIIIACLFVGSSYIIIPLFLLMRQLNLLNNLVALGVLYAAFNLPYSIFLLTGYLREVPRDYEEAAILDGCTPFQVLLHIVIPLCKSIIFTITIITTLSAFGEYMVAMIVVTDPLKQTFPVAVTVLHETSRYATNWGALFAALVISLIPTIVLFVIGEKYAIKGMSIGGLKG